MEKQMTKTAITLIGGFLLGIAFSPAFLTSNKDNLTIENITTADLEILQEEQKHRELAESCNLPIGAVEYILGIPEADFITKNYKCDNDQQIELLNKVIPLIPLED